MAQQPPPAPEGPASRRRTPPWIFANPWVGFIGSLASIASIPLAVYIGAERRPRLMFAIAPSRAVVLQRGAAGSLRVLHRESEIRGDISAAQVALWNAGRTPVRASTILSPIRIELAPPAPILEATLRSRTRDVTGLTLELSQLAQGKVGINFEILEKDDGASIQLLYAGKPDHVIVAPGVLEGQPAIERAVFFLDAKRQEAINVWLLVAMMSLVGIYLGWSQARQGTFYRSMRGVVVAWFLLALLFFALLRFAGSRPPFPI